MKEITSSDKEEITGLIFSWSTFSLSIRNVGRLCMHNLPIPVVVPAFHPLSEFLTGVCVRAIR